MALLFNLYMQPIIKFETVFYDYVINIYINLGFY